MNLQGYDISIPTTDVGPTIAWTHKIVIPIF